MSSETIGKRITNSINKEIHLVSDFRNEDVKSVVICDAVILDYTYKDECIAFLKSIRSSFIESIYLIPVFILTSERIVDSVTNALCDDVISSIDENLILLTLDNIKPVKEKFSPVNHTTNEDKIAAKLLRYMYSRNIKLKPLINKNSHYGYEYPIVDLHFTDDDTKKMFALFSYFDKIDYLNKTFVDKLHLCTNCYSSFINYRESCPKCEGYNLTNENKIHHFNCHYEGLEREFTISDSLRCPKCKLELKNNGVDFEISAVVYHCVSCNHQFADPVISCFCFSCQKVNQIDKLIEANVYSYELSDKEITDHISIEEPEVKTEQTHYGFISYTTFVTFLKYEIERVKRNKKYGSIGKFEIIIPPLQKQRLEGRYNKLLAEIADFLKNTTMPTDILTITPNNAFLIISTENSMTNLDFLLTNIQMSVQKLLSTNFYDYDITINIKSNIIDGSFEHDALLNSLVSK